MASEETKDASRNTIFGAVSVIITYLVNMFLPETVPSEVKVAILTLVLAAGMWALTYIDSRIHRSESKSNGLLPF